MITKPYAQGFTTLETETNIENLPVDGTIPSWLSGALVRNGPAKFEVGSQSYRHWFDGAAMLHRFAFSDGQVSYGNKYLRSPAYKGNNAAGSIKYSEFATDPCRSIFQRVSSIFSETPGGHNANVNITKIANKYLAMTETPIPIQFDLDTLSTVGVSDYSDEIGFVSTTAHPHFDPARNVGVNHIINYGRETNYSFALIPNELPLRRNVLSTIKVGQPSYIHSFGMTENYLILAEFPYFVNPLKLLVQSKPFIENFVWKPEEGTRFFVVSKEDGALVHTYTAPACFAFHHINAFEQDGDIFVDMATFDDATVIKQLFLNRVLSPEGGKLPDSTFRRYHLAAGTTHATYKTLSEHVFELPRINYRYNQQPYRYAYGVSYRPNKPADFINAIVKVDTHTQQSTQWFEDGCYPGEPVFVAERGADMAEDQGAILTVVLDSNTNTSFLLVLDAATFSEVARVRVPHHIPFGFHGQYFS